MTQHTLDEIEALTREALLAHGAGPFPAAEVARAVRSAESYGNRICGLYYVESYCLQLASGRVAGQAEPIVTRKREAAVHVDACYGFAQPAFTHGLVAAVDAARRFGVATLAVGHAHTCTSLGYFTEAIAAKGLIGFGFTNASPIVAPPGGKTRVIGTNPIAFSVPDGQGGLAMHMDQSTTTVALGKITMAKAAGEKIPEGWAVDSQGHPTTDPAAALEGSLVSVGAYKGWGFGLLAEVCAAALTGSALSCNVEPLKHPHGKPHNLGQYYILIDPAAADGFAARLEKLAEVVAQDAGARLPGQGRKPMELVDVVPAVWVRLEELARAG
ncbi:MAG: Ldh family oxidoreductase [Pseudomonadota bacterium]